MQQAAKAAEVRATLLEIYNKSGKVEEIERLTDDEVLQLAEHLKDGVPFATPVFDGASESEIRAMLDMAYPAEVAQSDCS